ncbi:MAG TPA: hypothetical protein VJ204_20670, partial [Solirubrobacterales bacterium]|nr:hypothetical protein [Solirubrobacterales bacterium]
MKAGSLSHFVDAWRSQVLPFRAKFGFTVVGAWHTVDESEFTWQLTYDGPQSLQEREQEYADARARHRFDDDPATYLEKVTVRF